MDRHGTGDKDSPTAGGDLFAGMMMQNVTAAMSLLRDSWVSVRESEELNSAKSSVIFQSKVFRLKWIPLVPYAASSKRQEETIKTCAQVLTTWHMRDHTRHTVVDTVLGKLTLSENLSDVLRT